MIQSGASIYTNHSLMYNWKVLQQFWCIIIYRKHEMHQYFDTICNFHIYRIFPQSFRLPKMPITTIYISLHHCTQDHLLFDTLSSTIMVISYRLTTSRRVMASPPFPVIPRPITPQLTGMKKLSCLYVSLPTPLNFVCRS